MNDIIFIHSPVTYNKKTAAYLDFPRMGTMYMASILEQEGYEVGILDNRDNHYSIAEIVEIIRRQKPKIVGHSSMTSNIRGTVQLAKALKQEFGDSISFGLGGPHSSADPEIITRFPYFDWTITGEADITIVGVAHKIIKEGFRIKGIFEGEAPMKLDSITYPAWHLIDWQRYQITTNNIMASRGCPFRCVFCSIPAIKRISRFRSPKNVVDEMIAIQQYTGKKMYTFLDDTLTLNRQFTVNLMQHIIDAKLNIKFEGHTRANLIDEELVILMKKAGLVEMIFGVESGSERVRNQVIGKGVSDESIDNAMQLCKKHKISADMYLMLSFPTETKEEVEETINYPGKTKPNIFGLHITIPLPGARIWDIALAEGVIPPDTIDRYIRGEFGEGFNNTWPLYVNKEMSLKYLKDAQHRAYRNYYFTPGYVWHRIKNDIKSLDAIKKDIIQVGSLLKSGQSVQWE
jgi:radical SAM superfamily enzyme YgiQ (UPF0313 family)